MSLTKISYSMITGAVVNVLDYGAYNDGSNAVATTAAIKAAIAASAYKTLYFPAGIYALTTGLTVDMPMNIVGEYSGYAGGVLRGAVLKINNGATFPDSYMVQTYNYREATFKSISFDLNGASNTSCLVLTADNAQNWVTVSARFENLSFEDGNASTEYETRNNTAIEVNRKGETVDALVADIFFKNLAVDSTISTAIKQWGDNSLNIIFEKSSIAAYVCILKMYGAGDIGFNEVDFYVPSASQVPNRPTVTPKAHILVNASTSTYIGPALVIASKVAFRDCYVEPSSCTNFFAIDGASTAVNTLSVLFENQTVTYSGGNRTFYEDGASNGVTVSQNVVYIGGKVNSSVGGFVNLYDFNQFQNQAKNAVVIGTVFPSYFTNIYGINKTASSSFTPTVSGSSTAGTATYATQTGTYTKINQTVFFNLVVQWTGHTGTGGLIIKNLPFNANATMYYPCAIRTNIPFTSGQVWAAGVDLGQAQITLNKENFDGTTGDVNIATQAVNGFIFVSGQYEAAFT